MRTFLTLFGGLIVMGLVIISVFANFWFGTLLISGQERWLYGAIFALLDALKTVLIPAAGLAAAAGLSWKPRVAFGVFALLTVLSFSAEIGLYSITKNEVIGDAKAVHAAYEEASAEKADLAAKLAGMGSIRSIEAIEADIAGKRHDPLFDRSKQCTDATAIESRNLCQAIERLNAERGTARDGKDLQRKLDDVKLRLSKMNVADALKSVDPQAEALSRMTGLSPDTVRTSLAILIAALIELGSGLGFWLMLPAENKSAVKPAKVPARPSKKSKVMETAAAPMPEPETCIVERWVNADVLRRKDSFCPRSDFRTAFESWCQANGVAPVNDTAFGRALTRLNFTRKKVGGVTRYENVALRGAKPALKVVSG